MNQVILPFLPAATPLADAIARMRERGVAAVVTERDGGWVMLRAEDLFELWNGMADAGRDPGGTMLGRVVPRAQPMLAAPPTRRLAVSTNVLGQPELREWAEALLAGHVPGSIPDPRYAVLGVEGERALVLTASERSAASLQEPDLVACAGMPVHYWRRRDLRDPNHCNAAHRAPIA